MGAELREQRYRGGYRGEWGGGKPVSVSLLNVFSHTHLQLHFPEIPSKCRDTQHFINIILVIVSHHLAFAVGNATHFSQINSHKLINNSVSPFRLLTFRPIPDNLACRPTYCILVPLTYYRITIYVPNVCNFFFITVCALVGTRSPIGNTHPLEISVGLY